jgi:hypothetical protein
VYRSKRGSAKHGVVNNYWLLPLLCLLELQLQQSAALQSLAEHAAGIGTQLLGLSSR